MKSVYPTRWGTALGAGLFAAVALIPQSNAQLVFEDGTSVENAAESKVEDRSSTREALNVSEKAQVARTQVVETAPIETEHYSKAELMRRERQREEIKNEDILQERLEELRLRDERRRTDDVMGKNGTGSSSSTVAVTSMQEETVVTPVTERPTKPTLAPAMANNVTYSATNEGSDESIGMQSSLNLSSAKSLDHEKAQISVVPRVGFSNMTGNSGYLQVSPHFSAGVGAEFGASDNFSFQAGYTYSQYGISMASNNWSVIQAQTMAAMNGQSNFQSINMNQNVFDAGAKLHVLGRDSRIRPFIGAGGGYEVSYINFAPGIMNQMRAYGYGQSLSQDYTLKRFLGYLSGGSDFRVAKNISVGAEFRYYAVLSVSESGNFSNYMPYFWGGGMGMTQDTAIAGASIARNNFYSILGNVTFNF